LAEKLKNEESRRDELTEMTEGITPEYVEKGCSSCDVNKGSPVDGKMPGNTEYVV
jgi:hypothetical protein